MLVKTFQKFFTTGWMLPLVLAGAVLLALARRFDALAVICAVPPYYIARMRRCISNYDTSCRFITSGECWVRVALLYLCYWLETVS